MRDRVICFVATGFGAGRIPVAPGTAGSVLGLGYWWLLAQLPVGIYWAAFVAGVAVAVASAGAAARALQQPDPPSVVIDELAMVPLALAGLTGWWWAVAFVLFRVFDIWKPWPIRPLQHLPGGWGIVADDLLAAGAAGILTHAIVGVVSLMR
jgi:phosphatidylglycerophosphatase A